MKWKKVSLSSLTKITSGYAFSSEQFSNSEGMPLIRIRNISDGYTDTYYLGEYDEKYLIRNGDFLIGMDGEFRIAEWSGREALLNQRVCKIESASERLFDRYLLYFLPNELKKIEDKTPHVTVKHLSVKKINQIQIPLPPLKVQKQIVEILDKADALLNKKQKQLIQIDSFLASVFEKSFTLEKLSVKKLSKLAQINSGITKGRKNSDKKTSIPYMRVANVQDGYLDLSEIKYIDATEKEIKKYKLEKDDLLLTEGGDPDKLGRGTLWNNEIETCIHQNHIFKVRLSNENILPEYLCDLIGSTYGKKYFLKIAKQTTGIATINSTQLKKFPVLMANIDKQNQYVKRRKLTLNIKNKIEEARVKHNNLFNSLLQQAFNGELKGLSA